MPTINSTFVPALSAGVAIAALDRTDPTDATVMGMKNIVQPSSPGDHGRTASLPFVRLLPADRPLPFPILFFFFFVFFFFFLPYCLLPSSCCLLPPVTSSSPP
jgi:hypothetical protein